MMRRVTTLSTRALALAALVATLALVPTTATAEPPRGTVKWSADTVRRLPPVHAGIPQPRRVIYMNRHGGLFLPGPNNSSANTSSIPDRSAQVGAFGLSDDAWTRIMACVRNQFAPFNVEVTDVDPGLIPHLESVVGGHPRDVGMDSNVGGVSPGTCDIIERSIVFTFSEVYGGNLQGICETVAQETAHSYGLDHELHCPDPMTYLWGCGEKSFRDLDVECGESTPRSCSCGGQTQNSVELLKERLGLGESEPPVIRVLSPADDDTVTPGFSVEVEVSDNNAVAKVELRIDGAYAAASSVPPYSMIAPPALPLGPHEVDVVAYDLSSNRARVTFAIEIAPDCSVDADCAAGVICSAGICLGDVGAPCDRNGDCADALCASVAQYERMCTRLCDANSDSACPDGYACNRGEGGNLDKCWPAAPAPGGCLSVAAGRTRSAPLFAGLALVALVVLVRRRAALGRRAR